MIAGIAGDQQAASTFGKCAAMTREPTTIAATSAPVQKVAQAPARTTRIIVPFAAGGAIDVTARVIAEAARGAIRRAG